MHLMIHALAGCRCCAPAGQSPGISVLLPEVLRDQIELQRQLCSRRCTPGCSRPALPMECRLCDALRAWLQVGRYGGLEEDVVQLKRDKNVLMMELVRLRRQQEVRNQPTNIQRSCKPGLVSCLQQCWWAMCSKPPHACRQTTLWRLARACWACCLGSDLVLIVLVLYAEHLSFCRLASCSPLSPMFCCGDSGGLTLFSRGTLRRAAGLLVSLPCCCRCRRRRWPGCRGAWTPQSSASSR